MRTILHMNDHSSDIVAVLDANVLYPMPLCDILLSLAEGFPRPALFLPRWSGDLLEEVRRNLVADGRCTPAQAIRRIQLMNEAFPEASVSGYENLIPSLANHEDNSHVLGAAVRARAQTIVTQSEIPQSALPSYLCAQRSGAQYNRVQP